MGSRNSTRLQNSFLKGTSSAVPSIFSNQSRKSKCSGHRNSTPTAEKGSGESSRSENRATRVSKYFVCGPKERRRRQARLQFKEPKFLSRTTSFQDGRDSHSKRVDTKRGLHGENRSKGCLPVYPNCQESQKLSKVSVERNQVSVLQPSLWASHGPSSLYKVVKTSGEPSEATGYEANCVPRRFHLSQPILRKFSRGNEYCKGTFGKPGVHHKPKEVNFCPFQDSRIFGPQCRVRVASTLPPSKQIIRNKERVSRDAHSKVSKSTNNSPFSRENGCSKRGNQLFHGLSALPSESPRQGNPGARRLRGNDPSPRGGLQRLEMVDREYSSPEWACHPVLSPRSDNSNRCIPLRLGSSLRRFSNRRTLVGTRKNMAHKCTRVTSHLSSPKLFYKEYFQSAHPNKIRQRVRIKLHKQARGNEKQGSPKGGRHNMGILSGSSIDLDRRACPGYPEWGSRLPVKALGRCIRLDAKQANFQSNCSNLGAIPDRPVRKSNQCPVSGLLQLEDRPGVTVGKCIHSDMDKSCSICIPPFYSHCKVPEEGQGGEGNSLPCDTQVDNPTLVCPGTGDECTVPYTDSSNSQSAVESRGTTPLNSEQDPIPNRLENFRGNLTARGLSEEAQTLITSSWRKGTSDQYDCVWKFFSGWCSEREINPFCASLEEASNFLGEQFEKGKSYSTLNSYRSALSATLPPIDGKPLGQHPLICRLLKGVSIKRPPQAKYSSCTRLYKVFGSQQ
ncbi:hypothetical protein HOLleu_42961 [Holothuria leucospilota]|uniref:Core-binding (CB) domain-containing protein n=1 Tax=Holothuria leucospilota TaxID=206669 RepID=A0A9Q0YA21_HOLLE|nr:hypothetical protein HOLleu_42961 [Holothuria leucospilota]